MDIFEAKQILGISDTDTHREAKRKYRRLIGAHHPDGGGDRRNGVAARINEAYAVLKKEGFFEDTAVSKNIKTWSARVNEGAYCKRNIYAPYHMDIDTQGLYQTITRGNYMWDPQEEEFPLFLRSIYHAAEELLEQVEEGRHLERQPDAALRHACSQKLFHLLMLQYLEPLECLEKLAVPNHKSESCRTYAFRAFLGDEKSPEVAAAVAELQAGEVIYPERIKGTRLYAKSSAGRLLGHVSLEDDALYYCIFPLLKAKKASLRMQVQRMTRRGKALLRLQVRIRAGETPPVYEDLNPRMQEVLREYEENG